MAEIPATLKRWYRQPFTDEIPFISAVDSLSTQQPLIELRPITSSRWGVSRYQSIDMFSINDTLFRFSQSSRRSLQCYVTRVYTSLVVLWTREISCLLAKRRQKVYRKLACVYPFLGCVN